MPIRPENVNLYPPEWPAISWVIRWIRALGWCECRGECDRSHHHLDPVLGRCRNINYQPAFLSGSKVVLTVAHLDHDPTNCHPANLRAFCQGCHLSYDHDHHADTRRRTRGIITLPGLENLL